MTAVFYYDLNSPYAYLAAQRIDAVLPVKPAWQPIAFGPLVIAIGKLPWSLREHERGPGMAEVERRAADRGLPPVAWPDGWPAENYSIAAPRAALHAATPAQRRALSLELFRLTFVEGLTLDPERVVAAGGRVGIDEAELRAALAGQDLKSELREATDAARERGVTGIPTVAVGDQLFWGDDRLEDAATAMAA